MANEILPAGLSDVSLEVLANEFLMLLAERDGSILTHPALFHATGSARSNIVRVPHYGLDAYNLLSATTPGSAVANTAMTLGHTSVTVAMRAKRYWLDDLARFMTDGKLDPAMFARDAAVTIAMTLVDLIANVTDDFTTQSGTSGVNAAWSDIIDAKTKLLIAKASGPMLGILHPQQWGDLETNTLSLGAAPAQVLASTLNSGLGSQFKGSFLGIDFFTSSSVPTANAGADRAGAIVTRGGVAWADAMMDDEQGENIVSLGRARLERWRQGDYLATSYITSYACGVAKAIDGAGVSVVTDA